MTRHLVGVYLFLSLTSARNRMKAQLRRLRQPRYAVGLILGIAYIWFFLFNRTSMPRQPGSGPFESGEIELLASFGTFLMFMRWWLFGNDRSALAFSPAEVQFLFAAPLSRRSLIQYKLLRSQFAILFNAVLLTFIFGRGGTLLPAGLRILSLWALFSIFTLHRLGATLVRTAAVQHGKAGAKKNIVALVVFGAITGALLWAATGLYPELRATRSPGALFDALIFGLRDPIPRAVLAPFRALLAPTFATSAAEWARAFPIVLIGIVLHYVWVLRSDAAFEDAAVAASAERARRIEAYKARRSGVAKAPKGGKRTWFPLAPTGNPAVAILWKNMLAVSRTGSSPFVIVGLSFAVMVVFGALDTGEGFATTIAFAALMMTGVSVIVGARFIRNDLRQDLVHSRLLRTYPLSGAALVGSEIAGATIVLTAVQLALLLVAAVVAPLSSRVPVDPMLRVMILLGAPTVLLVINSATVMIQNAAALAFPAWTRLGTGPTAGVEVLGQSILMMVGSVLAFLLALTPAVVLGGAVYVGMLWTNPETLAGAIVAGVGVGLIALAAEVWVSVVMLGKLFERGEAAG